MKVTLLNYTKEPIKTIACAGKLCYSNKADIDTLWDSITPEEADKFVEKLISSRHFSPLEHSSFTFAIEGVSRSLMGQITRHRLASFCVTGDTIIPSFYKNTHKGVGKKRTIKELYDYWSNPKKRQYVFAMNVRSVDEKTGTIVLNKIKEVFYNGIKEVYELRTESGRKIKCTDTHKFFTNRGWLALKELNVNDQIYVNGLELLNNEEWLRHNYLELNRTRKELAEEIGCCEATLYKSFHKFDIKKPHSKYPNRKANPNPNWQPLLDYRAKVGYPSGSTHPSYKKDRESITISGGCVEANKLYKNSKKYCENCNTTEHLEIHHIDKNPRHNTPDNIKILCSKCHHLWHRENAIGVLSDKIISIEYVGKEEVYDLQMEEPYHSYVGNGFILHNCVRSQRYCSEDGFDWVTPPSIANNKEAECGFNLIMDTIQEAYDRLITEYNIPKEDARAILPNACCTRMIMTMNVRELFHFFNERCCSSAQLEIRTLAYKMLELCKGVAPALFKNAGAKCISLGYCPEEKKRSCGKMPTYNELCKN